MWDNILWSVKSNFYQRTFVLVESTSYSLIPIYYDHGIMRLKLIAMGKKIRKEDYGWDRQKIWNEEEKESDWKTWFNLLFYRYFSSNLHTMARPHKMPYNTTQEWIIYFIL